jgi:hypothetical protein
LLQLSADPQKLSFFCSKQVRDRIGLTKNSSLAGVGRSFGFASFNLCSANVCAPGRFWKGETMENWVLGYCVAWLAALIFLAIELKKG